MLTYICSCYSLPNILLTNDKVQDELYHTGLIQPHLNHRRLSELAIQATVMVIQPQILCGYSIGFQFGEFCTPNLDYSISHCNDSFPVASSNLLLEGAKSQMATLQKVWELECLVRIAISTHTHITISKYTSRTEILVSLKWDRIQKSREW